MVYQTNQLDDTIDGWIFDSTARNMNATPGSPYVTDQGPVGIAVSPDGKFLYVSMAQEQPTVKGSICTNTPAELISYAIDHSSGALTLVQRLNLNEYCGRTAVIDPSGKFLYVAETSNDLSSSFVEVVSLDGTGHMSVVSGSPFPSPQQPGDLVVDGNYIYATDDRSTTTTGLLVYQRDTSSGAVQYKEAVNIGPQWSVTTSGSGAYLYSVAQDSGTITEFSVNQTNGALTQLATFPSGHDASQITADATGHYVAVAASDGLHVYTVGASGALTSVPGSPFDGGTQSASFDPKGAYLTALGSNVTVYSLSGTTVESVATETPGQYPAMVVMVGK